MTRDITADRLASQAIAAGHLVAELNSDDAQLNHDMVEGETSFLEAVTAAVSEIDDCEIIVAGCKEKEGEIAGRRHRVSTRLDRLRGLIEQAMLVADLPSVSLPTATLSVKRVPPKPVVFDEAAIPSQYWKAPPPALDKAQINKEIKNGADIPGISMSNGTTSLQIRRT